mgnify:FL=1|jgi:hypothetical protein
MMNDVLTAISTVGFPTVMCGTLCYYIYKVQTPLIEAINKNTEVITKMVSALEVEKHGETENAESKE